MARLGSDVIELHELDNSSDFNTNNSHSDCYPPYIFNATPFTKVEVDFAKCYSYFLSKNKYMVLQILLGISIAATNVYVFLAILFKNKKINPFNKILMAQAVCDFAVGSFNLPFLHFLTVFRYWPFSVPACIFWSSLDNSLNVISIYQVLLMSWTRYISMKSPTTFASHLLVRHSFVVCFLIWICSFIFWVKLKLQFKFLLIKIAMKSFLYFL